MLMSAPLSRNSVVQSHVGTSEAKLFVPYRAETVEEEEVEKADVEDV